MGRQLNFYLTPKDLAALQTALESTHSIAWLAYRSSNPAPRLLPDLGMKIGHDWLTVCLAEAHQVSRVHMTEVPAQGYWTTDVLRSAVIQLTRCYFDGEVLRRGRLFFYPGYYDEQGELRKKSNEFLTWAEQVFRITRRQLRKHSEPMTYIGTEAVAWAQSGVRLVA